MDTKTVRALALHPDNSEIIYAATQSYGIFKSTDGGASWPISGLGGHDVTAVAINPRNPRFVYAGTYGDGVWTSHDGGYSWDRMPGLTGGASYVYSLTLFTPEGDDDCQILYAGTTDGVWARAATSFVGPPANIAVSADPTSIPVGGSTSTIRAIATDACGNPVADGTVVTFTTSLDTISPSTAYTLYGVAVTTLTSGSTLGMATVTARSDSVEGTTNVTFTSTHTPTPTPTPTSEGQPNLSTSTKTVTRPTAQPGDSLLYTIVLNNTGTANADVSLTDAIPFHTTYVPGTVSSVAGIAIYNATLDQIEWAGTVHIGISVAITFQVGVNDGTLAGTVVVNTAIIDDGASPPFARTATTIITASAQ